MAIHVARVDWATHEAKLRQVRERVFVVEHGVAPDLEFDGLDPQANHFLALNDAGLPLGTARLLNSGEIGRVAVLPEHRRRGIGRQLLSAAAEHATALGLARVFLLAERQAEEFCRKSGFSDSKDLVDPAATHVEMALQLPIPFHPPEQTVGLALINRDTAPSSARPYRLVTFDSEHDCRAAVEELLRSARASVVVLSPTLDSALFATRNCVESISALARRSRHTQVRILVEDAKAVAADNHPLLQLARRLSSKVTMRRLPDDHEPVKTSYMVVDGEAVWMQPDLDTYVGWSNLHDRVEARRLLDEFNWLFERSSEDPELRLLSL